VGSSIGERRPVARVESNVVRFYDSVLNGKRSGINWWDKVVDGAFGFGVDQKIRDGYRFLVENYPNPEPCHHSPRRLFA
jgi:hypothetical protein